MDYLNNTWGKCFHGAGTFLCLKIVPKYFLNHVLGAIDGIDFGDNIDYGGNIDLGENTEIIDYGENIDFGGNIDYGDEQTIDFGDNDISSEVKIEDGKISCVKDDVLSVLCISSAHNKGGPPYRNIAQILHLSNFFELKRRVYIHLQAWRTRKVLDIQCTTLRPAHPYSIRAWFW